MLSRRRGSIGLISMTPRLSTISPITPRCARFRPKPATGRYCPLEGSPNLWAKQGSCRGQVPRATAYRQGILGPRDPALLARWIELNKDVLIAYWDGIIEYTEDAIHAIRRLG